MKIKILVFLSLFLLLNSNPVLGENARTQKKAKGPKIQLNDSEKIAMKSFKQKVKICAEGKKNELVNSCKKLVAQPPPDSKKSKITPEMKMCKKMMVKQTVIECTRSEARNLNPKLFGYWKGKFSQKFQKTVNEYEGLKKSIQQSYSTEKGWMKEFGSDSSSNNKKAKKNKQH